MPIVNLQKQWRELGRIRMGNQVTSNGKRRPSKLDTWRLTSASKDLLDRAATVYGGQVKPWDNGGAFFELVTTTDTLDVIVPPGQSISQWNEMWSGGGCVRRCDGITEVLTDSPCKCPVDPAQRNEMAGKGLACKPTTRLNVMLPKLPDIGVWRLESHGYYAAVEMSGTAELLMLATENGRVLPARLRLDQRTVKRIGQANRRFAVPVLEVAATAESFLGGAPVERVTMSTLRSLPAGDPPVPEFTPSAPKATPPPQPMGEEPPMPSFDGERVTKRPEFGDMLDGLR